MLTGAEVTTALLLSVTLALSWRVPKGAPLVQPKLNGPGASTVPTTTLSTKNSTWATVPSGSFASVVMFTTAGATKGVPLAGDVMLIVGRALLPTVIFIGADVTTVEPLSVALDRST